MSSAAKKAGLPAFIKTEQDLEIHLNGLVRAHSIFAPVRAAAGTVALRWLDPGYAGLAWVITSQQISITAGRAIYNRTLAALGELSPRCILAADDQILRAAGLSAPKIRALRAAAAAADCGSLKLDGMERIPAEEAIAMLTAIKGIGPWTAEVYLIFAAGHADIMPARDVALQEAARLAFNLDERPGEKALKTMAGPWQPFRSAAARLLWAYYRAAKQGRETAPVPL